MRAAFALSSVTAVILSLTILVTCTPLSPRSYICSNDGRTRAGTIFGQRSLSPSEISAPLQSRVTRAPCTWCLAQTATFLFIQAFSEPSPHDPPGSLIRLVLSEVLEYVIDLLRRFGDGVIDTGSFNYSKYGVTWYTVNDNNHQITRGVLRTAILTFISFAENQGEYGYAAFNIFDGANQVGKGVVRPGPRIPS